MRWKLVLRPLTLTLSNVIYGHCLDRAPPPQLHVCQSYESYSCPNLCRFKPKNLSHLPPIPPDVGLTAPCLR